MLHVSKAPAHDLPPRGLRRGRRHGGPDRARRPGTVKDGVPRSRAAIVEALAERHHRTDILHTLIRLVAAGTVIKTGSEYTQAVAVSEPARLEPDQTRASSASGFPYRPLDGGSCSRGE